MLFPSLRNHRGFLSDYYLGTVFGKASGPRKSLVTKEVEFAFRTLRRLSERAEAAADAPKPREVFARPLLRDVLGYHLGAGDKGIHPLYVSAEDEAQGQAAPVLLAYVGGPTEDLDAKRDGKAPPTQRLATELARAQADLRYGLLVTAERLKLIRRKGDGPAGAYLELDLAQCVEGEDRESLAAAIRLFGLQAFTPSGDGRLPIEEIERESREHAETVSEDLKRAVFDAAEHLIQALLDARGGSVNEEELLLLRDAALTCLYRLLFILYAEARDPRLLQNPLYRDSYSLDGLVRYLARAKEPPAANRFGLWDRLLALFAVHGEGLPGMKGIDPLPARGGDLFDPKSPAGRLLEEVRLNDATVAKLVSDLTATAPRRGVGREWVSFRELDIEQLGAVYEGLLEYEPRVPAETTIEVRVLGKTCALPPRELVRLAREKNLGLKGPYELVEGTEAAALHPESTPEEQEEEGPEAEDGEDVEGAAEEMGEEPEGLKKGATAQLVRRLERGRFHFVPGPGRKGSGSFYTPLVLVRDLVRHALDPLAAKASVAEIESLRILDPACGSAHFLVEAMRFLGQALHRAYVRELGGAAPPGFRGHWDADGDAPDEEARAAASEARAWCKRRVAERCLYGVDLNPTAVELARVSLWIESLAGERPLSYFEHHVRCGNSILGSWLKCLASPPLPNMRPQPQSDQLDVFVHAVAERIRQAAEIRRLIDAAAKDGAVQPDSLAEQRFKEYQRRQAEQVLAAARLLFDLRSASAFVPEIWREWPQLCGLVVDDARLETYARSRPWWDCFQEVHRRERFFHWELEFPEIFLDAARPGFDAILGNPPWDKVKPDRKEFYGRHDLLIRVYVGGELDRRIRELERAIPSLDTAFADYTTRVKTVSACLRKGGDYRYQDWEVDGQSTGGDPDAFKFFVERAHQLVREGGRVGLVVPSAIYNNEGCTGLRHLLLDRSEVERFYAFENRKKVFPIDSRYKFVSLVFRKGEPTGDGFPAAFMRHDLAELADPGPKPWTVVIRRNELERLSPGTLAFLEYQSPRDREILLKIYGYDAEGNPVRPRRLLGDQGPGTWNARFYSEFHMTNDRDLWTDSKTGKLYNPRQVLGPVPGTTDNTPYYNPAAWTEIRARMAEAGFWPLYEGKHIEQFLVDIRPIERWVNLQACEQKYGKLPDPGPKLLFRDIASNTNEHTCVAAVLPERSCAGHSLTGIAADLNANVMAAVLNSFPLDFSVRLRTAGTHLSFTYVGRLAVPTAGVACRLPTLSTESVAASLASHVSDLPESSDHIWQINRAVAEAYGLTPDDLAHILSTFPVFARKRPALYTYLQAKVEDWTREVKGAQVYAVPAAGLARVAEIAGTYAAEPARQPPANAAFQQAAVMAWVVHKLHSSGNPVSRFRVHKLLYLIEAVTETGLFTDFCKQAAGPYDPGLRYKGPEDIAVRQRRWLVAPGTTQFEPGPHIEEALRYAPRYIDTELAELVLEEFRRFKDDTLERWTTVHLSAVELQKERKPATPENVVAYIQSVPEWQPKLSRGEFAPDRIADAIEGLRRLGLPSPAQEGQP